MEARTICHRLTCLCLLAGPTLLSAEDPANDVRLQLGIANTVTSTPTGPGCLWVYVPVGEGSNLNVETSSGTAWIDSGGLQAPPVQMFQSDWVRIKVEDATAPFTVTPTLTATWQKWSEPWGTWYFPKKPDPDLNLIDEEFTYVTKAPYTPPGQELTEPGPLKKYDALTGAGSFACCEDRYNLGISGHCGAAQVAGFKVAKPIGDKLVGNTWFREKDRIAMAVCLWDTVWGHPNFTFRCVPPSVAEFQHYLREALYCYPDSSDSVIIRRNGGGHIWNHGVYRADVEFKAMSKVGDLVRAVEVAMDLHFKNWTWAGEPRVIIACPYKYVLQYDSEGFVTNGVSWRQGVEIPHSIWWPKPISERELYIRWPDRAVMNKQVLQQIVQNP